MKMTAVLGGALLLTALPAGAGGKLAMRVSPAFMYEPATLTIQLYVEPDPDNRAIAVVAESEEFYRSSETELDGEKAPRTNVFRYRSLPAGAYEVRSVLMGSRGDTRATATTNVVVIGAGGR